MNLTPTLSASAFSDPDAGNTHSTSRWQVRKSSGAYGDANSYDSGTILDLTSHIFNDNVWRSAYRRTVSLLPATSIPDYQVKVELSHGTFDYSKVAGANGEDLRFFDGNGTPLSYWIETWNTGGTSTIWVKVPNAGTDQIFLYYGNPAVAAASDGKAVFDLFDDFGDGTLDAGLWESSGMSESGGYAYGSSNNSGWRFIRSITAFDDNVVLKAKVRMVGDRGGQGSDFLGFYDQAAGTPANAASALPATTKHIGFGEGWCADWMQCPEQANGSNRSGVNSGIGGGSDITVTVQITRQGTSTDFSISQQGGGNHATTLTSYSPTGTSLDIFLGVVDTNSSYGALDIYVDQVLVRKYVAGEPVASLSSESTSPKAALMPGTTYSWHVQYRDNTGLWSSWSDETSFTTFINSAPQLPAASSPRNTTIDSALPTLTSSAFSDPNPGDSHGASQWRISTASGDYTGGNLVVDSGEDTDHLTTYPLATALASATTYYWQVRHRDISGLWSDWSAEASFDTVANFLPDTPVNSSPAAGATGVSRTPTLTASAYSDGDGDPHRASQWRISTGTGANFDANILYDTGPVSGQASHTLDATLSPDTTYYWQVRYQDDQGAWTGYSAETSFTTESLLSTYVKFHWKFDETSGSTAYDTAGNHNGSVTDAVWNASGRHNGAISFDGYDSRVTTSFSGWQPASYSVEFWIKPANCVNNNQRIISRDQWGQWAFYFGTDAGCNLWVGADGTQAFNPPGTLDLNVWQHLVFTYVNATATGIFYKNGVALGSSSSMTLHKPWTEFFVGQQYQNTLNGMVDGVVVYTRALTAAEVQGRYQEGAGPMLSRPPAQPVNTSPADGATGITIDTGLTAGAFSDPDGNSHQASRWRIRTAAGAYGDGASYDSGVTGDLTAHTPSSYVMVENIQYFWQVQYQDNTGAWSAWSEETDFTIRGNNLPNTPSAVSPKDTSVVTRRPSLSSSAFADPDAGDTHRASQWRVSTASGDYAGANLLHDSGATQTDLTGYSVPADLTVETTYYWQVRHQDNGEKWSAWSQEAAFTTPANLPPRQPVNASPADTATGVSRTPTLIGSAFSDPEGSVHQASQWRLSTASGPGFEAALVYDTGPIAETIRTQHLVATTLSSGVTCYWQVRYQDGEGLWSAYSEATSLTPIATAAAYAPDGSGYIRDWLLLGYYAAAGCSDTGSSYINESGSTPAVGDGPYSGKYWTAHHDTDNLIDFDSIYGGDNRLAYAAVYVYSGSTRSAQLRLGSDDAIAAWLNGVKVHNNPSCRGYSPDQDVVAVTLLKGWNRLLIKVTDGGGGWGFYCRFTNTSGTPLTDLGLAFTYNPLTSGDAPDRPVNTSPAAGATGVSCTPTLNSSVYSDPNGDAHQASRWQIRKSDESYGGFFSYDSGTINDNLTSHTVPIARGLTPGATYYWHVQYQDSDNFWSSWSAETSFTVRGNSAPNTPTAVSPSGVSVTSAMPTLVSSAFSDPDAGDAHAASQWRLTRVSGDYSAQALVHDSGETAYSLTSYPLPVDLAPAVTVYWQVRHRDAGSAWSAWSAESSFSMAANLAPEKPSNQTPLHGAIEISQSPTLAASAFVDTDSGDSHQASQWRLSTAAGAGFEAAIVYNSGPCADLVSHTAATPLAGSTAYYWQVRYQDNHGNWSDYSDETMFTTTHSLESVVKLHWKFDETSGSTAYDTAGHHNGSVTDATWNANGKLNGALSFDGYDSRVTTSFSAWQPPSYSVEFWIKPANCASYNQRIISRDQWGQWAFYFGTDSNCGLHVGADGTQAISPPGTLDLNVWQHFVFTYHAFNHLGVFYKNGVALGSSSSMTEHKPWTEFLVGLQYQDTLNGMVDEVVVYERDLTAAEVLARYQAGGALLSTPPNQPVNVSPASGATGQAILPTFSASAFSDPNPGNRHNASRWQVRPDDGAYGDMDSVDSGITSQALTSLTLDPGPAWADPAWSYRRKVSLAPATPTTDFQVRIKLTPAAFDYAHAKADGSDLRFFSTGGAGLDYAIESWNTAGDSTIWVKVADSSTSAIYLYYGNPAASPASAPATVFDFWDGFDGTSLDSAKWPQSSGAVVAGGIVTLNAQTDDQAGAEHFIYAAGSSVSINSVIEFRHHSVATNSRDRFGITDRRTTLYLNSANYIGMQFFSDGVMYADTNNGGSASQVSLGGYGASWQTIGLAWTTGSARYYRDDNLLYEYTTNVPTADDTLHPFLRDISQTDWVRVRKFAASAPVAGLDVETTQGANLRLLHATTYYWRVQYQDDTGAWSRFSAETAFTTVNDAAPAAPTSLTASTVPPCRIDLSWTDAIANETGFRIERKIGAGGSWSEIALLAANASGYSDTTGLAANTTHFYRVKATNSGGDSAASNEASATTTAITYYQDADSDSYGNPAVSQAACSAPAGHVTDSTDCDDANPEINPATSWYKDGDQDRYSDGTFLAQCTDPGADYYLAIDLAAPSGDCNDHDPALHPATIWHKDTDGDGYSDGGRRSQCLDPGPIYYRAAELTAVSGDCDDSNAAIKPGATEVCDGKDNDCDGETDEGFAADHTYFRDADGDGDGDAASPLATCQAGAPAGYVATSTDCSDTNAAVNPGATESCNGVDDNCNGQVDDACTPCAATPAAPSLLTATAVNSRLVELGWTVNSTCEDGFVVEMLAWNGLWIERATVGPATASFLDTNGIQPATEYRYRVRAFRGANSSANSNEAVVTTPAYTPGDRPCD
ncbi:MAG: DUF2341 domain-containing protein [Thermodesulfobacteriota bacterium]